MLHDQCGSSIKLQGDKRSASRRHARQEFNNGIVISSTPLQDDWLFHVTIDCLVSTWSGSLQLGVTANDPRGLHNLPSSAAHLRGSTWLFSGTCILFNGKQVIEEYGKVDLDKLFEGDRVGVVRRSNGNLHFVVNGVDQGIAASNTPNRLFAIVDLYGKCSQITVNDSIQVHVSASQSEGSEQLVPVLSSTSLSGGPNSPTFPLVPPPLRDPLRFHVRCGLNVELSCDGLCAARTSAVEQFNNGVIITHRPLRDNELFEIRIEELVAKWSGSLEVGVTSHSPEQLDFPETMTSLRSGTIMMNGLGILLNGVRTKRVYATSDLDQLKEGDTVGVIRRCNGDLHFVVNGQDQGVAASDVPHNVYGVVDLYGRAAKVSIVAHEDSIDDWPEVTEEWNNIERDCWISQKPLCFAATDSIAFSTDLRTATFVSSSTAPSAVLISERALRIGEAFYLELTSTPGGTQLWVGVSLRGDHSSNIGSHSGLWWIPGKGVMNNGSVIDPHYGKAVTVIRKSDKVGVCISREAEIHFVHNDRDMGVALKDAPLPLWGAALIVGPERPSPLPNVVSLTQCDKNLLEYRSDLLCFHSTRHGSKALVLNSGMTAVRIDPHKDFNLAIVTSNRPLRDNEIFEVVIEEMEGMWTGSLEVGVTAIPPEQLSFPSTMTNVRHDTWMLSGSAVMCDGAAVSVDYGCDLDFVRVGSRVGVQRREDGSLHYYIDGRDMGPACTNIPNKIWAVIDMYGQCARVSVVHSSLASPSIPHPVSSNHQLNSSCGHNVVLRSDNRSACRTSGFDNGMVFSNAPLDLEELFEVQIEQVHTNLLTGNVIAGLTTYNAGKKPVLMRSYESLLEESEHLTWIVVGRRVLCSKNGLVKDNYGSTALVRPTAGERIGVQHCSDGTMHIYVNGDDQGVAASNLPKTLFAVFDLFGPVESISLCSSSYVPSRHTPNCYESSPGKELPCKFLESLHGDNIQLVNGNSVAKRICSFNNAIVLSSQPISVGQVFTIRLDRLTGAKWDGSLSVGLIGELPPSLPLSAVQLNKLSWIICGHSVYVNGNKIKSNYGPNLDLLKEQATVGILVDSDHCMRLLVNGVDQGVACGSVFATRCYAVCDVYARCEKVSCVENVQQRIEQMNESLEKAHLDDNQGRKENSPLCEKSPCFTNCPQHLAATHLIRRLCLPWSLVESQQCLCSTCCLSLHLAAKSPRNCSKFLVKMPRAGSTSSWDIAYSLEVPLSALRKCLDHGQLLSPSEFGLYPVLVAASKKNDSKVSSPLLKVTPSLAYALTKAPLYSFQHPKSGENVEGKVVLQALICPDSYQKVAVSAPSSSSPEGGNLEEWHTKEKSATAIHAILVRLGSD